MNAHKVLMDRPRLKVTYDQRSADAPMGRFGGGWQWALGFRSGSFRRRTRGSILIDLLTFTVRLDWRKKR